jgi:hypothetical protein
VDLTDELFNREDTDWFVVRIGFVCCDDNNEDGSVNVAGGVGNVYLKSSKESAPLCKDMDMVRKVYRMTDRESARFGRTPPN